MKLEIFMLTVIYSHHKIACKLNFYSPKMDTATLFKNKNDQLDQNFHYNDMRTT